MDDRVKNFLQLYKHGYSEAPYGAIIKSGLANDLKAARGVYVRLRCDIEVAAALEKIDKQETKKLNSILTDSEEKKLLSRIARNCSRLTDTGDIKDPRKAIEAIHKLALLKGEIEILKKVDPSESDNNEPKLTKIIIEERRD